MIALKVELSTFKENCVICFIEKPLKMMKTDFILKVIFVLKIYKFLFLFKFLVM